MKTACAQAFFELSGRQKKQTFSFQIVRNLIIVQANLNGTGPYNFVLDTGVGIFLITDPNLVDSLHLQEKRSIEIQGLASAERMEAWVTPSVRVDIKHISCPSLPAAILKKDYFGLSSYAGIPIHGLIGYEFFSSFGVRIDFISQSITVSRPDVIRPLRKSEQIPLFVEERKPYIKANVKLRDGRNMPVKLVVDLGAGHPLLLERISAAYFGLPNTFILANLGVGLGGPISGYLSRINLLQIGDFTLNQVITSFPFNDPKDGAPYIYRVQRDGNLGIGVLRRFLVMFDYAHGVLYLRKNGRFTEPFEHDMSGIEYYASGDKFNRIFISRVEPGSAADSAGITSGDEILAINLKGVELMSTAEIDEIFRSKDQRNLLIELVHNREREVVILRLRRRI
ncbi:MAG: aspartyl protease family protein [Mucilaginibacter polytrichastri]|nr:aspartyl protease family protein [Mucilaginibacter polytrichastri]